MRAAANGVGKNNMGDDALGANRNRNIGRDSLRHPLTWIRGRIVGSAVWQEHNETVAGVFASDVGVFGSSRKVVHQSQRQALCLSCWNVECLDSCDLGRWRCGVDSILLGNDDISWIVWTGDHHGSC